MNRLRNTGKWITLISFYVWLLETVIFLIVDGWHYAAIRPTEIMLDTFAGAGVRIGLALYVGALFLLADKIFDRIHEDESSNPQ